LVPETRDPKPGAFDVVGVLLSVAALGTLVYGLIEAPERGWTDLVNVACFCAAAVFAWLFVAWERRVNEPMLNLAFFENPPFSVASGALGVASFALFGGVFATTQYLQDAHGYSALQAGAAMLPITLGLVMGSGTSTKVLPRLGTSRVATAGLLGLTT